MIISSIIVEDSPQADGRRQVRERHIDHIGCVQAIAYTAEVDVDINAVMIQRVPLLEQQAKDRELQSLEQKVLHGIDPFPQNTAPIYNTQVEWRQYILKRGLSNPDPVVFIYAAGMLDKITDIQLMGLLGISQNKCDEIRVKAEMLKNVKAILDSYTPPLVEE